VTRREDDGASEEGNDWDDLDDGDDLDEGIGE